ncbi:hypothetical protein [Qipengyuania mesophila]|uniref:hypothetical protein n=1 Tax=Qipengyuania mesophila TaxID=2867246 RepID=UPI003517CED6
MSKISCWLLLLPLLAIACSSEPDAPDVTIAYLAGEWAASADDCFAEYGLAATYSSDGTIVFEDGEEPYEIQGNEVHFYNPFDDAMGHEVVEPLDADRMLVTQMDGEQHVLVRCPARPANVATEDTAQSPERALAKGDKEYTDAELYGVYTVKLSCVDIHGRPMALTGCFAGNRNPGRVGYVDANDAFSYDDMQLLRDLNRSSETFALTAPFTFYAQSFGNTPLRLLGQLFDGDTLLEEKLVTAGDTIALGRGAVPPPVADKAELAEIMADDLDRKAAEIEELTAE